MATAPQHLVIMGISGSGKTTIASLLAAKLGWKFAEADEFHSAGNIRKMTDGVPLQDDDRWPWLESMQQWMSGQAREGASTIVTCSALKRSYRDVLAQAQGPVRFVHLLGDVDLIRGRLNTRSGHFMPESLLPSHVQTLQALHDDEPGLTVSNTGTPDEVTDFILDDLGLATR